MNLSSAGTLPSGLERWLLDLSADFSVLAPSSKGPNRIFDTLAPAAVSGLATPQHLTLLPFKKIFLPPTETLFSFQGSELFSAPPLEDTILFGLHICELSADRLLWAVMENDRADSPFLARRGKALTIGVPCVREPNCFCEKTGHDRIGPHDFDLFLSWPDELGVQKEPYFVAGSEAGARLAISSPLEVVAASEEILAPRAAADRGGAGGRWPLEDLPEKLRQSFGAVMWDELAERCLGCGNCTVVCPLCYCFVTRDETGLDPTAGRRLRQWDSCQLVNFARVAGGHNFREARSERIWYRFSHKFMRMTESFGRPGCSGCGACLHFCPAEIDPQAVIESVLEVTGG